MAYIGLGNRRVVAVSDTTGLNPGNWSCDFSASVINSNVPFFEIYTMSVTGINQVSTLTVYVNGSVRTTAKLFGAAEWDPSQPILMSPTDQVVIASDQSATGTATAFTATVWLRYDPSIQPGEF